MTKYISEIVDEAIKSETEEDAIAVLRGNNRPQLRNILQFAVIPKSKKRTFEQVEYKPDDAPIGLNPTNLYKVERQLYLFKAGTTTPVDHLKRVLIQMLEGMDKEECATLLATINGNLLAGNLNKSVIKQAFPEIVFDESIDSSDGEEPPKKRSAGRPPGSKNKKKTKTTKKVKGKITSKKKDVADAAGRSSNSVRNLADTPTGGSDAGEQSQAEETAETPSSKSANLPASSTAGMG